MKPRLSWVAAALPFVFSPSSVFATTLDPVIVSATRVEQQLSDVLPSATVITREEIERAQAPTLIDLLQGQPGIEIGRNGGPGTVSSIFMRGQESTNVAVLIDGIPVQRDAFAVLKLVDIPPSQIEKIEILRGNMGAVHGESAVGGAIHIFTRAGAGKSGPMTSVSLGSRNTSDLTAGYNLNGDVYKFGFSVQRYKTDGNSAMNSSQDARVNPDDDAFERESVFVNGEKTINSEVTFGFQANRIEAVIEYDGNPDWGYLSTDELLSKQKSSDFTLYSRLGLSTDWSSRVSITQSNYKNQEFNNNAAEIFGNFRGNQLGLNWSNAYKIGPGSASFGVDITESKFKTNGENYKRDTNGVYVGYTGQFERLDYQANLRRDQVKNKTSSVEHLANTWLLGLGFLISDYTKLTTLISTSFRAPSAEEYGQVPSLKPEEHKGFEIGIAHATGLGKVRAIYFDNESTNAITYNHSTFKYENIGMRNNGFEFSLNGNAAGWDYGFTGVFQDPRNTKNNTRLARRAKEYGSIDLTKTVMDIDWSTKILWSGNRKDSNNPSNNKLNSSYTVVNLTAAKKLTPEWTGRVKVENAFNEKYQLAHGFDAVPRGVFVTLDYRPR